MFNADIVATVFPREPEDPGFGRPVCGLSSKAGSGGGPIRVREMLIFLRGSGGGLLEL